MRQFFDSGRIRELQSLEELYDRKEFSFAVIYGRRRIGKTSLIGEFIRRGNKKAIRFTATENTDIVNRENFSQSVFSVYPELSTIGCFPTWESALTYIANQSKSEKIVVEIDEFPYLAKSNQAISSEIQKSIDNILQNTNILLILCGSSMSFMENQVLGYQSPLYGRRTSQYRIMPLDYYDSAEFFYKASLQDKLLGYAVTGGVPQYLNEISRFSSIEVGIASTFFTKNGFLYEEPQNLLKQELREPALYNTIITAIAGGATKLGEIATKVKEPDSKIAKYIRNLIALGILEKEFSIFAKNDRSGIYCIKDNMYRFWHRYVPGMVTLIENGYDHIYEKRIKSFIPEYMGRVFEAVCRQYLLRLNVRDCLPFLFDEIGRWWGGNPITKKETEVDIVAVAKDSIIVGECKWQNEEMGQRVYNDLREKAAMFTGRDVYYFLFSKSGFTPALIEAGVRDNRLTLVSLDDLFHIN
jgi:AAA+ ATPase superfamily predicted ATPase